MNKEFIPYEQILELKALGFDGILWQEAFRWFRENGYISQITYDNFHNSHGYQIDGKYHTAEESFLEYESAEFTCLEKLIEIVKTYNQNK